MPLTQKRRDEVLGDNRCDFSRKMVANRLKVLGARSTWRLSAVMWRVDSSRHPKLRGKAAMAARHDMARFKTFWDSQKTSRNSNSHDKKKHGHGLSWVASASLESLSTYCTAKTRKCKYRRCRPVGVDSVAGWPYNQPNECAKRKLVWLDDNDTVMNLSSERDAITTAAVWEDASDARSLLRVL